MKAPKIIYLLLASLAICFNVYAQVPFPNEDPPIGVLAPWGYEIKGTNWDTSPFLPFKYNQLGLRIMPPNGVSYNASNDEWVFSDENKKYPVIVFLHGVGEAGEDNNNQLKHGGQIHRNAVLNGTFDGYLIYPQSSANYWTSGDQTAVYQILQILIEDYQVDPFRIVIHGLSNGGVGVWETANRYTNLFAGILSMSGTTTIDANAHKFTPVWQTQGGLDQNPSPDFTQSRIVNPLTSLGANFRYEIYEDLGHGVWNRHYNESDFFPFINRAHKANPWVLYEQSEFCPGDPINVTIGVSAGFSGYEWRKDGTIINGANSNTINVTEKGVYSARVRRGADWSVWSPIPVNIKTKEPTITPPIQLAGLQSTVIPSPSGNSVTLELPEGYEEYEWRRVGSNAVIGTQRTITVNQAGDYIATVTERFGCSSNFSDPFTIINRDGTNIPDPINGLTGKALSKTDIELNWANNPNPQYNETNFEIYRAEQTGGPYKIIAITNADVLKYTDQDLVPNKEYFYLIRPINNNGAAAISPEVKVKTQVDNIPPTAPLNLIVTGSSQNSVQLAWDPSTDDVGIAGYDVYRNGVKAVVASTNSITVFNLTASRVYNFTVKARDLSNNESPFSNQVTVATVSSGLQYKYYEGQWSNLPNFNNLTPVKTGKSNNVDISVRNQNDNFGFLWEGFINIPVAGTYQFETRSDDGSKLYISNSGSAYNENNLVVNNDGLHGNQYRSGNYTFNNAGSYPIAIAYFEAGGGENMEVFWTRPGQNSREKIPDNAFKEEFNFPEAPPAFPTQITATPVSYNTIDVGWIDNSNNEKSFQVYRAVNAAGPFYPVATTGANITTYRDGNLQAETTYYYRVMALSNYGESGFSDEINTGLTYYYYESNFSDLDQLDGATPKKEGLINNFSLNPRERNNNIAFKYNGSINLPTSGQYTFYTESDDGSELFINGTRIVNNDFNQGMTERSGNITLNQGSHQIEVRWRQGSGGYGLNVRYAGPGLSKRLIPDTALKDPDVNATTLSLPPAPNAPTNFNLTAVSESEIRLNWNDNSNNEEYFEIYRSVGNNANFLLLETVNQNIQSYRDQGLFTNVTYYYYVVAVNVGGENATPQRFSKTLNNQPVLSDINDFTIRYGEDYNLNIYAEDPDQEQLTLSVTGLPNFAQFSDYGDGSGVIIFSPSVNNQGTFNITVRVEDESEGFDQDSFTLVVNDNYLPVIESLSNVQVNEGGSLNINLSATDQNTEDLLSWSATLPEFASLIDNGDGSAVIQVNPDFIHAGSYEINVVVEDSKGGVAQEAFTLTVNNQDPSTRYLVNFTNTNFIQGGNWNDVLSYQTGSVIPGLVDASGNSSSIQIEMLNGFQFHGAQGENSAALYPASVTRTYFFDQTGTKQIRLSNLPENYQYEVRVFASRAGTGTRITNYTINGTTKPLNVLGNTSNTVVFSGLLPDANNSIDLFVERGNGEQYLYITALELRLTPDTGNAPASPTQVSAQLTNNNTSVQISWNDRAFNETSYEIFRATELDGNYGLIGTVNQNIEVFTDNNVSGGTELFYKVRAVNSNGASAFSSAVNVIVPNIAPSISPIADVSITAGEVQIVNITATDDPNDQITLATSNLPAFVTLNDLGDGTGTLTIAPTVDDIGEYSNITILASDQTGDSSSEVFNITVNADGLETVLLNFTQNNNFVEGSPWNNLVNSGTAGASINNLSTVAGTNSGMTVTLLDSWAGANELGVNTGNNSGVYPDRVIRSALWEGSTNTKRIRVSGLDGEKFYDFVFFGSREGSGTRNTEYTVAGSTVSLNAMGNSQNTVKVTKVVPNANGEIVLSIRKASSSAYGYLNSLEIQSYPQGELPIAPTDLTTAGISKTEVLLNWKDNAPDETGYEVWRSNSSTGTYNLIATVGPNVTEYINNNLAANSTFYYKVRATLNTGGTTEYTNVSAATTISYTVSVNFNLDNPASSPWNNFNSAPDAGFVLPDLLDDQGRNTGIDVKIMEEDLDANILGFNGDNPLGMNTGNNSGVVPDNVMRSTYWLDPGRVAQLKVSGLDLSFKYNFVFFASRNGGGDRTTTYTINGESAYLNASYNISNTVQINNVLPNQNGEVLITIVSAPGSSFGYIGGLIVQASDITQQAINARLNSTLKDQTTLLETLEVEIEDKVGINIFPNPVSRELYIDIEGTKSETFQIKLFDLTGKLISSIDEIEILNDTNLAISTDHLKEGVYILELLNHDKKLYRYRIIKQ